MIGYFSNSWASYFAKQRINEKTLILCFSTQWRWFCGSTLEICIMAD